MDIGHLLDKMVERNATTLHLSADMPPLLIINDQFSPLPEKTVTSEEVVSLADSLMNSSQKVVFSKNSSVNFAYAMQGKGRMRVTFYKQKGFVSAIFRLINDAIPSFDDLQLPEPMRKVSSFRSGLVIIGGPSGSGKSSTLAAMLEEINTKRAVHIVTLEDPIEYLFESKKSLFSQREIGTDTFTFPKALREAVRQDADVIMVGEMRDQETMGIALTAAETGVLVLATMHTADCTQTLSRIVGSFPPQQQHQIATQLAISLRSVFCQQLVMCSEGNKRVPAVEILFATPGIQKLIREKKFHQIYMAIESGGEDGMQTLDQALQKLYRGNIISDMEVITKAVNPSQFKGKILKSDSSSLSEEEIAPGLVDLGEEMISMDKKMICYRANLSPGEEGHWTSSALVTFDKEGLILTIFPGSGRDRVYVSDFNIVSNRVPTFPMPKRFLVRFRMEKDAENDFPDSAEFCLKLFAQPEKEKIASYYKTNLSFPLPADSRWHTWVINIPEDAVSKMLKISMLEFPAILTKVIISDIIFF